MARHYEYSIAMLMKTSSETERQHSKKMPRHKTHQNTQHTRTTSHNQVLAISPFTYASRTIANERHPERNEDSILVDQLTGLVAVFDGVGGSAAGEIASQTAAQATLQRWKYKLRQYQNVRRARAIPPNKFDLCTVLHDLILESDELVRTDGARRAGTDDLATTVALATFCREPETRSYTMVYAHVGDSRIYLLREGERIQRLTSDDGLLAKLVENQIVNEGEALHIDQAMRTNQLTDIEYNYFRLRGGITQALGGPQPPVIHIKKIPVQPGDRILLCTDGIHDNLIDEEIEAIIRNTQRTASARVLIERSLERSHQDRSMTIRAKPDDMSAIVVTCRF